MTAVTIPMPSAETFGRLLTALVGAKVHVTHGAALPASDVRGVALYGVALAPPSFAAACDATFLASVGAALAMFPPVTDASGGLERRADLVANAWDVLRAAARLFGAGDATSSEVGVSDFAVAPLPPALTARLADPRSRVDLVVRVREHPEGKLSLLALR